MKRQGAPGETAMLLSVQMLADPMNELFWEFRAYLPGDGPRLRGCLVYSGQKEFQTDTIYLLPPGQGQSFPRDQYCYLTQDSLPGAAPHLDQLNQPLLEILNQVLATFQRYQRLERDLSALVTGGGTLVDLCRVGAEFFENPIFIHDDLFSVLAMSNYVQGMIHMEYNEKTGEVYVPLWLINDFKFDPSYQTTLTMHHAALWGVEHDPYSVQTLYVNLWDGPRYRGRLLVCEICSSLQPGQFQTAEYLAEYAVMLLKRDDSRGVHHYHSFGETLTELLTTGTADQKDLHSMLTILGWEREDTYLCLQLQQQTQVGAVRSDSALSSRLGSVLRGYASFYYDKKLCIVVNLTSLRDTPTAVRKLLAPQIRDCYMYGGMSNPVRGIEAIRFGFRQAEIALEYILRQDSRQWLVAFSQCALTYFRSCVLERLPAELLADPDLLTLRRFDRDHGTEYYHTLKTYLFLERNIPKTSQALNIHRTTLSYRLDKIQDLLHLDLEDREHRLYLLLSADLLDHPAGRDPQSP